MGDQTTKLCGITNAPKAQFIASPIMSPKIKANSFEVSLGILNLVAKDQFGGSASEDASMHMIVVRFVICKSLRMLKMIFSS
jgi:hypothetical protein